MQFSNTVEKTYFTNITGLINQKRLNHIIAVLPLPCIFMPKNMHQNQEVSDINGPATPERSESERDSDFACDVAGNWVIFRSGVAGKLDNIRIK